MCPLVSILRAVRSFSSMSSSYSQSFLSLAIGTALCLPLTLKSLVPTKATSHLLRYKSLTTSSLWSYWSTNEGFKHTVIILVNLAFPHDSFFPQDSPQDCGCWDDRRFWITQTLMYTKSCFHSLMVETLLWSQAYVLDASLRIISQFHI